MSHCDRTTQTPGLCICPTRGITTPQVVPDMPSEDVAIAIGHQDSGSLVRRLYGHRDKHRALDRIVGAYAV